MLSMRRDGGILGLWGVATMKVQDKGYFGCVTVPQSVFDKIDRKFLIGIRPGVLRLCANTDELAHLESFGIDTSDNCCDFISVQLEGADNG